MKKIIVGISMILSCGLVNAAKFEICMENSQWYPYVFVDENDNATGIQVDIIKKALDNLGMDYDISVMAWKRCLKENELGNKHAAVGASYKDERAEYMFYPQGAKEAAEEGGKAEYRVSQVEYVVTSLKSSPYEYTGDATTIPQPVYVPDGFSIIEFLEENNLSIDKSPKDYVGFKKMIKAERGSVVSVLPFAQVMEKRDEFKDKIHVSNKMLKSKSSFLPISKKAPFSDEERMKIWEEIKKVRESDLDRINEENIDKTPKGI